MIKHKVKQFFFVLFRNLMPYIVVTNRRLKKINKELSKKSFDLEPILYNENGEQVHMFYLSDSILGWQFQSFTENYIPKNIIWNKTNPALPVHFYSHEAVKKPFNYVRKRFVILVETEAIAPEAYDYLYKNPEEALKFDAIFTHSDRLLMKYDNAKFIPAGGVWYGKNEIKNDFKENEYLYKNKNISIVSSDKVMCNLHAFRIKLAHYMKKMKSADTFGTFDGGVYINIEESLKSYRFSIVIENTISSYCFTEKILNCFASMTIPIYVGATKIGDFFNDNGIIVIDPNEDFELTYQKIISCDKEEYEKRVLAVIDNYNRVKDFTCQEDYIIKKYKEIILS
ncbi:MAG: glycosyltransferase family 10 [Acholeplasma sp.]|nr:glycosyltransferase family 10 [Acholeplasma sp.]